MDDSTLSVAMMMRLPEKVSWSLGFGDEAASGKDWRGFLERLLNESDRDATVSVTLLLELPAMQTEGNSPKSGHQNE